LRHLLALQKRFVARVMRCCTLATLQKMLQAVCM
jgi:hypothetical protein